MSVNYILDIQARAIIQYKSNASWDRCVVSLPHAQRQLKDGACFFGVSLSVGAQPSPSLVTSIQALILSACSLNCISHKDLLSAPSITSHLHVFAGILQYLWKLNGEKVLITDGFLRRSIKWFQTDRLTVTKYSNSAIKYLP